MDLIVKISGGVTIVSTALFILLTVAHRDPPNITTKDLIDVVSQDDPKLGSTTPIPMNSQLGKIVNIIYLPECAACSNTEPFPEALPNSITPAIFIKKTSNDVPPVVGRNRLIIDTDGQLQRKFNAYRAPRIFVFSDGKLLDMQGLNESWNEYLGRKN